MKYLLIAVLSTVLVSDGCSNDTRGVVDSGTTDTDARDRALLGR